MASCTVSRQIHVKWRVDPVDVSLVLSVVGGRRRSEDTSGETASGGTEVHRIQESDSGLEAGPQTGTEGENNNSKITLL